MTKMTKHNVREKIELYLKSLKIRYNIVEQDNFICLYEIFVSSVPAFIQVEFDLSNDDDDEICIQFFTKKSNKGDSLYNAVINRITNSAIVSIVEEEIDELIEASKRFNKVLSKIFKHIESILDICEEYDLASETFITVHEDFND